MPTYRVLVTHDTTESCAVTVEASSPDEARERAFLAAYGEPADGVVEKTDWENDEVDIRHGDLYLGDPDGAIEEVEP